MAEPIRSKIVGLSWRKLKSDHVLQSRENVDDSPPAMNLRPRGFNGTPQSGSSQRSDGQTEKFLRRARSFRLMKDAFGTLRQVGKIVIAMFSCLSECWTGLLLNCLQCCRLSSSLH